MYSRKPVKKAPAPSAITVRSRKIQRPKAKRLSMFVWFSPFTRQSRADQRPKTRSAAQGAVHNRKRPSEQRFTPRAMNILSTGILLGSGMGCVGDLPHPFAARTVIDLGVGAETLQHAETVGRARGLVYIAEADGAGGAGLGAGGHVVGGVDIAAA